MSLILLAKEEDPLFDFDEHDYDKRDNVMKQLVLAGIFVAFITVVGMF